MTSGKEKPQDKEVKEHESAVVQGDGQSETHEQKAPIEEDQLQKAKHEYNELYDKYLRLYSEFENFRRRTSREKLELIDYAAQGIITDLLPLLDDFERAVNAMEKSDDNNALKDGVKLIFNKLNKFLSEKGVQEIQCIGKDFDPELHEAIAKIPAPKRKLAGKILDQVQKGYFLKEKVIRHSKVIVGE